VLGEGRESLQEVRQSPRHHLAAFCLPKAQNVTAKESKANPETLWLSDMNAAALLSHTTHGLQSLGLISASLKKPFSSIPVSCETTSSQCLSGLSAKKQTHRQKRPNPGLSSSTLTTYFPVLS